MPKSPRYRNTQIHRQNYCSPPRRDRLFTDMGNSKPTTYQPYADPPIDHGDPAGTDSTVSGVDIEGSPVYESFNNTDMTPDYEPHGVSISHDDMKMSPSFDHPVMPYHYDDIKMPPSYGNPGMPISHVDMKLPLDFENSGMFIPCDNMKMPPGYDDSEIPASYNSMPYGSPEIVVTFANMSVSPAYHGNHGMSGLPADPAFSNFQNPEFNQHVSYSSTHGVDDPPVREPLYSKPLRQPPKHSCAKPNCYASFEHKKDLRRHTISLHPTGEEPKYRCRCGTQNVRKDNYLRHAKTCKQEPKHDEYLCICDHAEEDKEKHLAHVKACKYGCGRPGRPGRPHSAR